MEVEPKALKLVRPTIRNCLPFASPAPQLGHPVVCAFGRPVDRAFESPLVCVFGRPVVCAFARPVL